MIDNKVLVTLYTPYLDRQFDIYIPVNKRVYVIIDLLKKTLSDLSEGNFDVMRSYELYNYENGSLYDMNLLIRDTDIRNNSRIMLV